MVTTEKPVRTSSQNGVLFGVGAYLCWGFFPLYWPLLDPAGSLEVLAHRFVWSMVFVLVAITAMGRWRPFHRHRPRSAPDADPRGGRGGQIALNWGGFIYGVTTATSSRPRSATSSTRSSRCCSGSSCCSETLRPTQWAAVGIGALSVVVLAVDYGRPPWIALLVAFSFATYGFLKKKADLGLVRGAGHGDADPHARSRLATCWPCSCTAPCPSGTRAANVMLLIGTGVVTAIPLLLFNGPPRACR